MVHPGAQGPYASIGATTARTTRAVHCWSLENNLNFTHSVNTTSSSPAIDPTTPFEDAHAEVVIASLVDPQHHRRRIFCVSFVGEATGEVNVRDWIQDPERDRGLELERNLELDRGLERELGRKRGLELELEWEWELERETEHEPELEMEQE